MRPTFHTKQKRLAHTNRFICHDSPTSPYICDVLNLPQQVGVLLQNSSCLCLKISNPITESDSLINMCWNKTNHIYTHVVGFHLAYCIIDIFRVQVFLVSNPFSVNCVQWFECEVHAVALAQPPMGHPPLNPLHFVFWGRE